MSTSPDDCTVLLVEGRSNDRTSWALAFARVAPGVRLCMMAGPEEARAYLSGTGKYADRGVYPIPQLIMADLDHPRNGGVGFVTWLRRESGLERLPVIGLASAPDADEVTRAYAAGANSVILKTVGGDALDHIIAGIGQYAALLKHHSHPPLSAQLHPA